MHLRMCLLVKGGRGTINQHHSSPAATIAAFLVVKQHSGAQHFFCNDDNQRLYLSGVFFMLALLALSICACALVTIPFPLSV